MPRRLSTATSPRGTGVRAKRHTARCVASLSPHWRASLPSAATWPRRSASIPPGSTSTPRGAAPSSSPTAGLPDTRPVEALWCGELIDARPAIGLRCDPGTILGSLPIRFNLASASGQDALTDIMSIPASVTRRAYQAAAAGDRSSFFYVRRFVDGAGGPDQYVAVTCRLAGGGARTPLALTDVQLVAGRRPADRHGGAGWRGAVVRGAHRRTPAPGD